MLTELYMKNAATTFYSRHKFRGGVVIKGLELWGGNGILLTLRSVLVSLFVFYKVKTKTRKKCMGLTMMCFRIKDHM